MHVMAYVAYQRDLFDARMVLRKVLDAEQTKFEKRGPDGAWTWLLQQDPRPEGATVFQVSGSMINISGIIGLPYARLRAAIPESVLDGTTKLMVGRAKGLSAGFVKTCQTLARTQTRNGADDAGQPPTRGASVLAVGQSSAGGGGSPLAVSAPSSSGASCSSERPCDDGQESSVASGRDPQGAGPRPPKPTLSLVNLDPNAVVHAMWGIAPKAPSGEGADQGGFLGRLKSMRSFGRVGSTKVGAVGVFFSPSLPSSFRSTLSHMRRPFVCYHKIARTHRLSLHPSLLYCAGGAHESTSLSEGPRIGTEICNEARPH